MKRARLIGPAAVALLAVAMAAAWPAGAHHSFAMYDRTKTSTAKGTVKTFQWTNPHVILWLVVEAAGGGTPQEWSFETTSPGVLTRAGWTRQSIKVGDRVSVEYDPLRDGSHGGSLNSVTLLATGQKLVPSFGPEKPGLK
jgi:Family of unknown function (DUF6152)